MNQSTEDKYASPIYSVADALLDSSLIRQTNTIKYNVKIYECGNYIQLYLYDEYKTKKDDNLCNTKDIVLKRNIMPKNLLTCTNAPLYNEIRLDNALRSKLQLQRIIKANEKIFKTFITLTYKENINDIKSANEYFNIWRTRIKKLYPCLKYVCVPEFQKRGAVHYHLISNIPIGSELLPLQKEKVNQYDVKYWNHGFSSVFELTSIDIVSYLSKYMTKDIDNRLFGRKRYFFSKELIMPKKTFFDTKDEKLSKYIHKLIFNKEITYYNIYLDKITNNQIKFFELVNIDS